MDMSVRAAILAAAVAALAAGGGCDWLGQGRGAPGPAPEPRPDLTPRPDPLPVQQARAYPETVTGLFLSLVDFEDAPDRPDGRKQVEAFAIDPPTRGSLAYAPLVSRTGIASMEVALEAGAELVFHLGGLHDVRDFTLLSLALQIDALRDDLQITLATDEASWTSHRTLVQPGWNTVLIDIQRLKELDGFNARKVRAIRLAFAEAAGPVFFNLDDVMLIDNRREIAGLPEGMALRKSGLDYTLTLPTRRRPVEISQSPDGLWRLAADQAELSVFRSVEQMGRAARPDPLEALGPRRVGRVEVLEANAVRLRIANTWYFPTRAGEWASMAVRRVAWEHTFYGDGSWVTHVLLNNAGGEDIAAVVLTPGGRPAWAKYGLTRSVNDSSGRGPVWTWSYRRVLGEQEDWGRGEEFSRPASVRPRIGLEDAYAEGDANRDRFDESQGCYFLASKAGTCRFEFLPPSQGIVRPVFRVAGNWDGPVRVHVAGRPVRQAARLADGSVLFETPGLVDRPRLIEVTGRQSILPAK